MIDLLPIVYAVLAIIGVGIVLGILWYLANWLAAEWNLPAVIVKLARVSPAMSTVFVNTYTHSVTYVADQMLHSLHQIIRESGLNPEKLADDWNTLQRGISAWLGSGHMESLSLEVYDPRFAQPLGLIGRWDFEIYYGAAGDGAMWVNTEDIKYHIRKAGQWPSLCDYRVVISTKPVRPTVTGRSNTTFRSTDGFVRQSIGTTIDGNGHISAGSAYWRKK